MSRIALVGCLVLVGCGPTTSPSDLGLSPIDGDTVDASPTCDESLRRCAHVFSWAFTGGSEQPSRVEVRGTFNGWAAGATPMMLVDGAWTATVALPYGADVEYKFWAQWDDNLAHPLWATDPNAMTASDGNSEIASVACTTYTCAPEVSHLELVAAPTISTTAYAFQVRFVQGAADLDLTKTIVTLDGAATTIPYDSASKTFSVSGSATAPSKITYRFSVQDKAGVSASLYVPFWIEATPFEWRDAFMYEIMTDRFSSGGTSKKGANGAPTDPKGDWKGGDFGGITAKINAGYFDQMGVNALWVSSPVLGTSLCEMGTGQNASHCLSGYHAYFPLATGWVDGSESDPMFAGITSPIDPHFGTADDLKALVAAAHAHGIRVLTDLVVNHVFADASPPNGQSAQLAPLWVAHQTDASWFNVPYQSGVNDCGFENLWDTPTSQQWNRTNCWFDPYLPDFDTMSGAVDDAIAAHAVWLMETFDLDGFRVDAAKQVASNVAVDLRSKISTAIATRIPFYMVGEALGSDVDNVMDCVGADRFDGSMNDPLHNSIVSTFLYGSESLTSFDGDVQYDEATWTGRYAGALMGHFFGSHDVPRAISEAANDVGDPWNSPPPVSETNGAAFARLGLAQAFLLTYDSLPILWMGDEFGLPGSSDPDNRRMMRFGSDLSGNESAALAKLQTLGKTRAAHSALRRGSRTRLYVDDTFYAYGRVDGDDVVVVAFNLDPSNSATRTMSVFGIGLTGTVNDVLSSTSATVESNDITLTVPPLSVMILTR